MKAVFVELPAFERHRHEYLDDDGLRWLQDTLMADPEAGDLIEGPAAFGNCAWLTRDEGRASAAVCE